MIAAQNIQIAGGTITEEDINYTISTVGEYASIEDIKIRLFLTRWLVVAIAQRR